MTPPHILPAELPFFNPVYIAVASTVEPTIVEATIVADSVALPLPEHITHHAADTILTDRATNRPPLAMQRAAAVNWSR
jgi:hypothetical protein